MLSVLSSYAVTWLIAEMALSFRPKRSSAFIFYPVFLIAAIAGYFGWGLIILSFTNYFPATVSVYTFLGIISASFFGSAAVLSGVKKQDEKNIATAESTKKEAEVEKEILDSRRKASGDDPRFDRYPNASIATHHRPDVMNVWSRVEKLGDDWADKFLVSLEADPKIDPEILAASIGNALNESYPFIDLETSDAYTSISSYGYIAEKDFRIATYKLHGIVDPKDIARNISKKYSSNN
jgi:hypothetical protein|tara:strand:+ start:1010 stop:1720 length:711 start_codon:yes stop_codon:yes gene_type:complete